MTSTHEAAAKHLANINADPTCTSKIYWGFGYSAVHVAFNGDVVVVTVDDRGPVPVVESTTLDFTSAGPKWSELDIVDAIAACIQPAIDAHNAAVPELTPAERIAEHTGHPVVIHDCDPGADQCWC